MSYKQGSDPQNNIILKESYLDKFHCQLRYENNKMMILDALSEHGTFVSKFSPIILHNSKKTVSIVCHDYFINLKFKLKTSIQNKNQDIYKLDESALVKHTE